MDGETARLRITLPKAVAASVDQLVGRQKRDAFIVEAVAAKLERTQGERDLEETEDVLSKDSLPNWESPEEIDARMRKGDEDG